MPTPTTTTGRARTEAPSTGRVRGGLAVLVWVPLALAALWLAAGAAAYLAATWAEIWEAAADRLPAASTERLAKAEQGFTWAIRLNPLHPDHRQGLARVIETRGARLPLGSPAARDLYYRALTEYRTAARARPSWPITWLALARVKARLGSLDSDFDAALARGTALGPWDPRTQELALGLGLPLWDRLSPQARGTVLGALRRGLTLQPAQTLARALRAGRQDLATPMVAGNASLEALLRKLIKTQAGGGRGA